MRREGEKMLFRIVAVLLAATLAACGGTIHTDPNAASLDAFRLTHLRSPHAVTLVNGVAAETKRQIRQDSLSWEVDTRQLTDTAIAMLGRGLENQGIRVGPQSPKSLTLRVALRGASAQFVPVPTVAASARIALEVDFGDGTTTWVSGSDGSAFGVQRAFEGAIRAALHALLNDPQFVAYLNRGQP